MRQGAPRAILQSVRIDGLDPAATPDRIRLRLTSGNPDRLAPGDWIRARAVLQPPPIPAMPGAYDFARAAYFQRLGAVGFTLGKVRPSSPPATVDSGTLARWHSAWQLWWAKLRGSIGERVLAALPGPAGALATALMTGDRSALPQGLVDDMRASGLAHLLAISGLHMGLVTGLVFGTVRGALALCPPVALRAPIKKWAAVAAAMAGFCYLMLSGSTVPTHRAFLMVGLVLVAVLFDRVAISLRLVCWAALAILLVAPSVLLSASFQMSFAAVTALVAGYEAMVWRRRGMVGAQALPVRAAAYLGGVALTSVIAILATAFFAAYHFNAIAVHGLLANMVAVPVTALWVMPWALVAFALMPFGLEAVGLGAMGWGLDAVILTADWIASLPHAILWVPAIDPWGLAVFVFGALWLCLWRQPWRFFGLPLCLAAALSPLLQTPPHVLISGDGRLQGIHHSDGRLWLSSLRHSRYAADVWRRRAGLAESEAGRWRGAGAADGSLGSTLRCDALGCLYRRNGRVLAIVHEEAAWAEDCAVADAILSLEPLRGASCLGPDVVVDRFDLWRNGAHAFWLDRDGVRIVSVRGSRGTRPWSPAPKFGQ